MTQMLFSKLGFVGLFLAVGLLFCIQLLGGYQVGGTFGYYAQKLHLFIHSGLPQFLDTAWRGLTM